MTQSNYYVLNGSVLRSLLYIAYVSSVGDLIKSYDVSYE